jgi:predicted transcriptional regulator
MTVSSGLKTGLKFLESADPVMRAIARESNLEHRLQGMARAARITWPIINRNALEQYKSREKRNELKQWASLRSQGKAVKAFRDDKISYTWLLNPKIFGPSSQITALKLRANVAADKVSLNRAKLRDEVNCRKCRVLKETLGHIIGQCDSTKKSRIGRHDEIKDLVLKSVVENDKEAVITREPTLLLPDGGSSNPTWW